MARDEQDREDLLAEATALVERAEWIVPGLEQPVVTGFRRNGCGSIYLGAERAYHFNTRGELRRAYAGGRLFKADRGRLVSLERHRVPGQVQLLSEDLDELQTARFLGDLWSALALLRQTMAAETQTLLRHVPADVDPLLRLVGWLNALTPPVSVAQSPRAE